MISDETKSILNRIYKSENNWKATHLAVWHFDDYLQKEYLEERIFLSGVDSGTAHIQRYKKISDADFVVDFKLPASKSGFKIYKTSELRKF
ncbi:MAG: hypothetical protein Q8L64_03650 [bacterium]|nr:hypothetical protein [bacterium]